LFTIVFLAGCAVTPDNVQPRYRNYYSLDKTLESREFYNKSDYIKGIGTGKLATEFNPTNGTAWYWLGVNYYQAKQYDKAIEAFKKVVKLNQEKIQVTSGYFYLGVSYHLKGDYNEAIRFLSKRLELDQEGWTYGSSFHTRSESYLFKGMYDKALQDASDAMKHLEQDRVIDISTQHVLRAFAHLGLGETDTAIAMITKAKQIYPDYNPEGHLRLIYYAAGDEKKLKELFKSEGGWLGIEIKSYAKGDVNAIQVVSVIKATPAEKGGLLTGDLIFRMNGEPAQDLEAFLQKIGAAVPGSTIRLEILRGEEEKKINIKLGSKSSRAAMAYMESNKLIAPLLAKKKMFAPAEEAEKNGDYRKAFLLYRKAPRSDSEIIGRIISLYHKLDPAPAIPEEARKHAVFAATATKAAKDNNGYDLAINEYHTVMRLAPWWADPYINLSLLLERRARLSEAVKALRFYLLASPNAPDTNTIQTKIYELEFKMENKLTPSPKL